jgi:hypothetical protein
MASSPLVQGGSLPNGSDEGGCANYHAHDESGCANYHAHVASDHDDD